jgi:hypothetical protein
MSLYSADWKMVWQLLDPLKNLNYELQAWFK